MAPSVLQIYRSYFPDPPGGIQESIRQLAVATSKNGISSRIFALSPKPLPESLQLPEGMVTRAKSWMAIQSCDLGGVRAFKLFSDLIKDVDVLHYYFPWPFADLMHIYAKPTQPAVLTYQSDVVRQRVFGELYKPLMWHMLRSMKVIIATSPAYVRTSPVLSDKSICKKVQVIPLGVEESTYPKIGDDRIFVRIGLGCNEPYFLFVGRLCYYKGLDYLVKAAKTVKAKIVIAGYGPEMFKLKELARNINVDNIIWAGQVTDHEKVALISGCRALVLPSHLRSEAFGMVLVEASMLGRPLISCEIGTGTSYINVDKKTGFVVPPRDPDALADVMSELLRNQSLSNRMGEAARNRYELVFSGPVLGKAYADLYKKLRG